ncbi:MAG TPA: hypothetical protein VNU45_19800 [Rummeliibacillus sp.]|nr:hypothetical protein [Rummeliibacillus sp.]
MDTFDLYLLLTIIPNISGFSIVMVVLLAFALLIIIPFEATNKLDLKLAPFLFFLTIFFGILSLVTPSEQQITKIVFSKYLTNIKDIEKLPPAIVKNLSDYLNKSKE